MFINRKQDSKNNVNTKSIYDENRQQPYLQNQAFNNNTIKSNTLNKINNTKNTQKILHK